MLLTNRYVYPYLSHSYAYVKSANLMASNYCARSSRLLVRVKTYSDANHRRQSEYDVISPHGFVLKAASYEDFEASMLAHNWVQISTRAYYRKLGKWKARAKAKLKSLKP